MDMHPSHRLPSGVVARRLLITASFQKTVPLVLASQIARMIILTAHPSLVVWVGPPGAGKDTLEKAFERLMRRHYRCLGVSEALREHWNSGEVPPHEVERLREQMRGGFLVDQEAVAAALDWKSKQIGSPHVQGVNGAIRRAGQREAMEAYAQSRNRRLIVTHLDASREVCLKRMRHRMRHDAQSGLTQRIEREGVEEKRLQVYEEETAPALKTTRLHHGDRFVYLKSEDDIPPTMIARQAFKLMTLAMLC